MLSVRADYPTDWPHANVYALADLHIGDAHCDESEVLARVKDFGTSMLKPKPTYLGKAIPIWGDGNLTNDENSDFT